MKRTAQLNNKFKVFTKPDDGPEFMQGGNVIIIARLTDEEVDRVINALFSPEKLPTQIRQ